MRANTSEVANQYTGAEMSLPRGDQMTKGHVVAWGHDTNGNVLGRAHTNPNFYTRFNQVKFAQPMSFHEATRNESLHLNLLIDQQRDDKVISHSDQQISVLDRPVTPKSTAGCLICWQWK